MRYLTLPGLVAFATSLAAQNPHDHATSPYAGMETRAIKALAPDEVAGLLAGEGMTLALAAELNGHPGPRHVLELADALGLTGAQRAAAEATMAAMFADARRLGAAIVAEEAALDSAFAAETITEAALIAAMERQAALRAELRLTHLRAHLATRDLLTVAQVAAYQRLRGYSGRD